MQARIRLLTLMAAAACGSPPKVAAEVPAQSEVAAAVVPEPAPEPEPEPVVEEVPEEPAPEGHADFDPDNDYEVGPPPPLDGCYERLDDLGVTYKKARIGVGRKVDGVYTCGARQVVRYRKGPAKIKYNFSPLLTCRMALALHDLESVIQEEAQRAFGQNVAKIDHLGTYNCRKMANYDFISEHSFANGLDLRRFYLEDGTEITVKKHFKPKDENPTDPKTLFLRRLSNRCFDDGLFSVVVTPYFDRLHNNHIHVDLARYRVDGSRP